MSKGKEEIRIDITSFSEVANLPEDFIDQLEEVRPEMSQILDTEAFKSAITQFIRTNARCLKSLGFNELFNRIALALQAGAVVVDLIDTVVPAAWIKEHSCYQPDGSRDFAKDAPKMIFLVSALAYGLLDFLLVRKLGPQVMAKFRQIDLPAITATGVCIFLENLKPNLGFDSTATVRTAQGLIIADFVREMIMLANRKEILPDALFPEEESESESNRIIVENSSEEEETAPIEESQPEESKLNWPSVVTAMGTVKFTASAVRTGTLGYTAASIFANVFVLAVMANDPKNFQSILNRILAGGLVLGALTPINDRINDFYETYITSAASNVSLSLLALMSLIDCWVNVSAQDNPVKWLAIAISVFAVVSSLTAGLIKSNASYASRSPAFFTPEARIEPSLTEESPLNINRDQP